MATQPRLSTDSHRSAGAIGWAELGLLPDSVIRAGIRRLNRQRLAEIHASHPELSAAALDDFAARMHHAPIALVPDRANEQHYEVPAEFFGQALGPHRKYSCCYWDESTRTLEDAEALALAITCERARLENGMRVLDLGCGWGSLSLWIASRYPDCHVTSVSNSHSQRAYVLAQAKTRGLQNITVLTRDMNEFDSLERFDRIVSIEMFEHMRNYPELFRRVSTWLNPRGLFFMHIFCHRSCAYEFIDGGPSDWMSRHFFSGGIMPSDNLPLRFQRDLNLMRQWRWSGVHYERTANAWLANMDAKKSRILPLLAAVYGDDHAETWFMRWRIFFMACAELFGHNEGTEWYVSHYLFERADDAHARA